eukprot:m.413600 g.413600  ORF g.413600 m.413600 type:complete len:74 (-) comp29129_c0_seq1:273-494(-)
MMTTYNSTCNSYHGHHHRRGRLDLAHPKTGKMTISAGARCFWKILQCTAAMPVLIRNNLTLLFSITPGIFLMT